MHFSTKKSTTTQDNLLVCVKEFQGPGTAYTPAPLIQQIPNPIRYKEGDPADAHELLIALINDISEPISQLFQGQMTSTHIEEDASSSLEERLYDFFQPEILEGENAYRCDTCQKPAYWCDTCQMPGDKNTLLHTHSYNLNSPLVKIDPGEKNSEPYPLRH